MINDIKSLKEELKTLSVKDQIQRLSDEILKHDALYDAGQPILSDSSYDELYFMLVDLENNHPEYKSESSPTQKIVSILVDGLKKEIHKTPILSLDKRKDPNDVISFFDKLLKKEDLLVAQQKLDGLTVILTYENGKLVKAVTRGGGGVEGENVTHTVQTIRNVPKFVNHKDFLELRAEVIIPYKAFEEANESGEYSNPRNLASGTIRQLDSNVAAGRGLKAIVFELVSGGPSFNSDIERIKWVQSLGFEFVETHCFKYDDSFETSIKDFIKKYETETRQTLEHMIDGLVFKIDNIKQRESLGSTGKHPRWALAFKFKSLDEVSKILDVTHQVGKTGIITPVAELSPVEIDGVTIRRATLHNYSIVKKRDIKVGDSVVVIRANDVIPKVEKSLKELRDGSEKDILMPETCPSCGAKTALKGEYLVCQGLNCVPQLKGKIVHFASKEAMDIAGLGDKTVDLFIEKGLLTSLLDVYKLVDHKNEICQMEGFKDKKVDKLIAAIEKSKTRSFKQFLNALSIELVGDTLSKILIKHFKNIDELMDLAKEGKLKESLLKIDGVGEIIANNMDEFFNDAKNIELINNLKSFGVQTGSYAEEEELETEEIADSKIKGLTFVVTGDVFEFENRKALQVKIESLGGKVTGSVTKKTNYLINNDKTSDSNKNKKAKELGIEIISEQDFLNLIK